MKLDRRNFMAGVGIATALPLVGCAVSSSVSHNTKSVDTTLTDDFPTAPPLSGPRINLSRAYEVMDRLNLDALVLGQSDNFYYSTGHKPVTLTMGHGPNSFSIITRQDSKPNGLVMPSFTYYFLLADVIAPHDFATYLFSDNGASDEVAEEPNLMIFADEKVTPLDEIEARRANRTRQTAKEYGAYIGARAALKKAFSDLGLTKARVATDNITSWELISTTLPDVSITDADDALRRIRPYKSDIEIALMRRAAPMNAEAAIAAVNLIRDGATYRDLRRLFYAEAAKRGNTGVFMVVDRISDDLFDAPFRDGQSFLIDAVSHADGYHGDYGRTVFIGEPNKELAKMTKTIGLAWDEVRHALKPGMKFSEITALGQATLQKLGGNYAVSFSPHSVGLYHTDHVGKNPGAQSEDLVLEKGMIISVDCPLLASGIGGSAHLEDLMLITADGSEPINHVGDQTIII
ncbi:MAG: Xaa-Pro peptidase family protein [Aliiglaciecola sp.]|uniref:M24 family metallopeptidase n=1 Tax=Aliiglaciecola sp. TaxID=1872441 RepID=UPI00329727E3